MLRGLIVPLLVLALAVPFAGRAGTPLEAMVVERAGIDYVQALPAGGAMVLRQISTDLDDARMIAEFWMDPKSGRFLANVVRTDGTVRRVHGIVQISLPVPVPTRQMMPGELIGPADFEIVDMPAAVVNGFAVTDPAELAGKEVRRMLTAGHPVMVQSVAHPLAVTRGAAVTIAYRQGPMRLAAPGRALTDARPGDEIRVVNLTSNKTVTAIAREDGTVEVLN